MKAITCEKCSAVLKVDLNKGIAFCEYCGVAYMLDDAIKSNAVEKWTAEMDKLLEIEDWGGAAKIGKKLVDEVPTDYNAVWRYIRALTHDMSTKDADMRVVIKKMATLELINELMERAYKLTPDEEIDKYDEKWNTFSRELTDYIKVWGDEYNDVLKKEAKEFWKEIESDL